MGRRCGGQHYLSVWTEANVRPNGVSSEESLDRCVNRRKRTRRSLRETEIVVVLYERL